MKVRVITALVGIPCLLLLICARGWVAVVAVEILMVAALYETYTALSKAGYEVCKWGGGIATILIPVAVAADIIDPTMIVAVSAIASVAGALFRDDPKFPDVVMSVYPLIACLLHFSVLLMILNRTYGTISGVSLVILLLSVAFSCDAVALYGGKRFGKHKLRPKVSPNKTVEEATFGVLGGIAGILIVRTICISFFSLAMPEVYISIVLGLAGALVGQIGDLSASLLKRHSGIKDYGNIFPGHGGVMDRLDSVSFILILFYCYAQMLNLLFYDVVLFNSIALNEI